MGTNKMRFFILPVVQCRYYDLMGEGKTCNDPAPACDNGSVRSACCDEGQAGGDEARKLGPCECGGKVTCPEVSLCSGDFPSDRRLLSTDDEDFDSLDDLEYLENENE